MTLSALASVVAAVAAAGWLLSKQGRTPRRTWLPTVISAVLIVAAMGTARADMPEGSRATQYLRTGDGDRAQVEAAAALMGDPADENAREVLDTVRLRSAHAASSAAEAYRLVKEPWFSDATRVAAVAVLEKRVGAEAARATGANDLGALRTLLAPATLLPERVQTDIRRSIALAGLRRCLESGDFGCLPASTTLAVQEQVRQEQLSPVVAEAQSALKAEYSAAYQRALGTRAPAVRMAQLAEAIAIGKIHHELTQGELSPGLKRLEDLHRIAAADDARQKQAQAEKERRAREREARAAAAKAAELERQERARSRASAPLQCCDGSLSPSCICAGSHRGCCSHHGGVCGCSQ